MATAATMSRTPRMSSRRVRLASSPAVTVMFMPCLSVEKVVREDAAGDLMRNASVLDVQDCRPSFRQQAMERLRRDAGEKADVPVGTDGSQPFASGIGRGATTSTSAWCCTPWLTASAKCAPHPQADARYAISTVFG